MNFVVSKGGDRLILSREEVHTVPEYLEEWAKGDEVEVAGRLLE
ncbi:MAG TPA: hypothetical protein VK357_09310 [Rubrobacteraceae bacterium]|nr:hypothetical protein [Rubrobacteraceae bacterium]